MSPEKRSKLLEISKHIDRMTNPNQILLEKMSDMEKKMNEPKDNTESENLSKATGAFRSFLDMAKGEKGDPGENGKDGKTPQKGVDYLTPQEVEMFAKKILEIATPKPGIHYKEGKDGKNGRDGKDGKDGRDGRPGRDGKDGRDGIDANKSEIIKDVLRLVKISLSKEIKKEKPLTAEDVIKEIKKSKAIDISEIRNANPYQANKKKLDMSDMRWHGGGISAGSIFVETPTGLINGVNKTYTVTHNIQAIINFTINGMYIHPNEYTFSGSTLTFGTALDVSLSGKSFTITYV